MIRNLKALGFVLAVVLATSAIAASPALAVGQGELTSDGPVRLTGTDTIGQPSAFLIGDNFTCQGHYSVGKENETEEFPNGSLKFRHKISILPLTTLTVAPTYGSCVAFTGAFTAFATITMNGCDYALHIGKAIKPGEYAVTLDLVCPVGQAVEMHVYSNSMHSSSACTYSLGEQKGLAGIVAKNVEEEGVKKVTLGGTVNGIVVTRKKTVFCSHQEIKEAQLKFHSILSGANEFGSSTEISLSDV
jgi:hypothetical protein